MMFRNYFKIAVRHLQRHKFITVINISGLAVGMACCILITLYVRDELGFDRFHRNTDNLYRVTTQSTRPTGNTEYGAATQFPIGPNLKKDISSIKESVRIFAPGNTLYTAGDKRIWEENTAFADEPFFRVFNFPLLEGNPATVLKEPYSIVLTESAAKKYFGNESPIGKLIKVGNGYSCAVTGVAKDFPANTDLRMTMIMSFSTMLKEGLKAGNDVENQWFMFGNNVTYVQLADHTDPDKLTKELKAFVSTHIGGILKRHNIQFALELQPVQNVHLHPEGDKGVDNSPLIWLYIAIAVFLILIACINFMNLTTARAHERAKEVGLRKVLGAERKSLVMQFLTESLVISIISFVLAILLVGLVMPLFNTITGKELLLLSSADSFLYAGLLLLVLVVGLVAGSYPALYLSGLIPVRVLKGNFITSGSRVLIRRGLVVAQFAVAVALIISTVVVFSQLRYWQTKNLGFDKEHLVNIYLSGVDGSAKVALLKSSFLNQSGVQQASMHNFLMGSGVFNNNPVVREGEDDKEGFVAGIIQSDFDLLKTTGIKLVSGRDFNPALATDSSDAYIINQAAARQFGFKDDAVGKRIEWRPGYMSRHGTIIGVVEDFNLRSLQSAVDPIIYMVRQEEVAIITLRLAAGDQKAVLKRVESAWNSIVPDVPFNFTFVEADIQSKYASERTLGKLFGIFSGLAIFIACMGLLGLSMLISRQRTKEIGIRKVLGASVANISLLLSKDFLKLVLIGICIASPIAWYGMEKWLQNFAFRVHVEWWVFLLTAVVVVLIALCTVSLQSVRAALMNPVKSLRSE
ncbi:ABC transporter permease [Chitinophaga ginsengisegetis]|uniref:ABC transporter permease n=1 Tax=Chitinophaga ginsengisegetis TaxID=393003 RepID=UPI000DBA1C4C|nr:ABC transporter permease [Chitinophaga ginsengisegetis]MDR6566433.1 putative ABC transport system permease protein [Chitinophaga ginsengisegetis]MDR6646163.1 putative ABC transport system permease protein [Chitinophaga ginsengisegetis]MDR6651245.1 putative ABC transport system permease protein [Chitinophaga ginsengisegetis]